MSGLRLVREMATIVLSFFAVKHYFLLSRVLLVLFNSSGSNNSLNHLRSVRWLSVIFVCEEMPT